MEEEKEDKIKQSMKLNSGMQKELKEFCDTVTVDASVGIDGFLGFEDFLKLWKIVVALQVRFSLKHDDGVKILRRAALAKKDTQSFAEIVFENLD